MNGQIIFFKEVLEPYKIIEVLTPKNLGGGELENILLSDLRENLDFCFETVSYIPFKKLLVDYIENYLIELRANIYSKKHTVKRLKNTERKFNKKGNKLDVNDDENDTFFEELRNYSWELDQERCILDYLHEQKHFIRNWVVQKRNALDDYSKDEKQLNLKMKQVLKKNANKEQISKNYNDNKGTKYFPKPPLQYLEIGSLFAQNYISEDKGRFYYRKKCFDSKTEIEEHIKSEVLKNKKVAIRQYIGATLNKKGQKNFYQSKKMMKNIIEYCKLNNIEITEDFQSKYNDLVNMH